MQLQGLPSSIVSNRDSKFTLKWWHKLHHTLGAKLLMSTSFHPQTDSQMECANRNIGQIFHIVIWHDQKDWVDCVDLTEFAINASIAKTMKFVPFELNGGYMSSMMKEIRLDETILRGIKLFTEATLQNLADAHDTIIEVRVFQMSHTNAHRKDEPEIVEGILVYLSTKNLNLPKGRARKLCPKFVGPWKVTKAWPETSTYELELPTALQECCIHLKFHVLLLQPYNTSNNALFSNRMQPEPYNFGVLDDQEWFINEILYSAIAGMDET